MPIEGSCNISQIKQEKSDVTYEQCLEYLKNNGFYNSTYPEHTLKLIHKVMNHEPESYQLRAFD